MRHVTTHYQRIFIVLFSEMISLNLIQLRDTTPGVIPRNIYVLNFLGHISIIQSQSDGINCVN
jgi:hypothetical protein